MEKKNKEIVIIDTINDNFEEWKETFLTERGEDTNDYTENQLYEIYADDMRLYYDETKSTLNKKVNGAIVAFADLGFWNGRRTGIKVMGNNLNSIVDVCGCDDIKLYCDRYNVKSDLTHHDGTHHLTFRLVPFNKVRTMLEKANEGSLTWEYFKKNSKSILKLVKELY